MNVACPHAYSTALRNLNWTLPSQQELRLPPRKAPNIVAAAQDGAKDATGATGSSGATGQTPELLVALGADASLSQTFFVGKLNCTPQQAVWRAARFLDKNEATGCPNEGLWLTLMHAINPEIEGGCLGWSGQSLLTTTVVSNGDRQSLRQCRHLEGEHSLSSLPFIPAPPPLSLLARCGFEALNRATNYFIGWSSGLHTTCWPRASTGQNGRRRCRQAAAFVHSVMRSFLLFQTENGFVDAAAFGVMRSFLLFQTLSCFCFSVNALALPPWLVQGLSLPCFTSGKEKNLDIGGVRPYRQWDVLEQAGGDPMKVRCRVRRRPLVWLHPLNSML
jgi:hypothetical protein